MRHLFNVFHNSAICITSIFLFLLRWRYVWYHGALNTIETHINEVIDDILLI